MSSDFFSTCLQQERWGDGWVQGRVGIGKSGGWVGISQVPQLTYVQEVVVGEPD